MMKRWIVWILIALCGLVSCTKEIKFRGEETEPKLVVYSLARVGEPLEVQVSQSVFFLASESLSDFSEDLDPATGTLQLFVNDNPVPRTFTRVKEEFAGNDDDGNAVYEPAPAAPLYYVSDYVPAEGDRLRLVVSFPGFDPVTATASVPHCTTLTVDSASGHPLSDDPSSLYGGSYTVHDLTLTLQRGNDPECFYGIRPYVTVKYPGEDAWDTALRLESDDIIFQGNGDQTSQLAVLFGGDDVDKIIPQAKIPAEAYTFRCRFSDQALPPWVFEDADVSYYLEFTTMPRDLYYYRMSLSKLSGDSSFSIFSEAAVIYSNVVGGFGCFTACSSVKIPLDL